MKRWLMVLPVVVLTGIVAILALRLRDEASTAAPASSPLTQRPAPEFAAAPLLPDVPGFATADLREQYVLVNIFASWCAPCLIEHPHLMQLKDKGLAIYGIAFGDKAETVAKLLAEKGNPFQRINDDPNGIQSIGWGSRGVPESFLVAPDGKVIWSFAGPITATQQTEIEALTRGGL
jgi:cytochrome c biogenesis protein CcmG/thiol:disulfide interchange protein DsbE